MAGGVWFQTASRLLAGEDIRPLVPRKPVESHVRDLMHGVIPLLARVRGGQPALAPPLAFPDPDGPLYGYDRREVQVGGEPRSVGTKDLVSNTLAIASFVASAWPLRPPPCAFTTTSNLPKTSAVFSGTSTWFCK